MVSESSPGESRTRATVSARKRARAAKTPAKAAVRAPRLSIDDWIDAAFKLLVTDGVSEVKITTLCERLGVTKGSFYWHFSDIDELMEAIADKWCDEQNDTLRGLAQVDSIPVDARLQVMAELLVQERTWAVEAAVRDWARTYEKIERVVRELDHRIFEVVQRSMRDLGFAESDARLRAGFLVYAGIGFIHAEDNLPTPTPDEVRAMFTLLTSSHT